MKIAAILSVLESLAPPALQESYDNSGLLAGSADWDCTGIIISLDVTEEVVAEAVKKKCNLIVAHHPIIFKGIKAITGSNYVERTLISAIKNDIALYAIHTNLDNVMTGVNGKIASLLGLRSIMPLVPQKGSLKKLGTFVPREQATQVRDALFAAGAGHIGHYSHCSFSLEGTGTFQGDAQTKPFVGQPGKLHQEAETRIEVIFSAWLESSLIRALKDAHPYEEVAYDIYNLANEHPDVGAGLLGELAEPLEEQAFLSKLQQVFCLPVIRHTALTGRKISRVAVCGGAGSFLISNALRAGADAFVTSDLKYHEFFDAEGRILVADIGHYESEQFTINLLQEVLAEKFHTFAILKTEVNTNPVRYFRE